MASLRLGVRPISKIQSDSTLNNLAAGVPTSVSGGSTMMPSWEVPTPISSSAQIMPSETTPLSFDFLMVKDSSPLYSTVPMVATMTFCPWATLGAPQTIFNGVSPPTFTVVTCRWSESGCGSQVSTSPTTRPFSPPLMVSYSSKPSTSKPQSVKYLPASSALRSHFTYCFSQL